MGLSCAELSRICSWCVDLVQLGLTTKLSITTYVTCLNVLIPENRFNLTGCIHVWPHLGNLRIASSVHWDVHGNHSQHHIGGKTETKVTLFGNLDVMIKYKSLQRCFNGSRSHGKKSISENLETGLSWAKLSSNWNWVLLDLWFVALSWLTKTTTG